MKEEPSSPEEVVRNLWFLDMIPVTPPMEDPVHPPMIPIIPVTGPMYSPATPPLSLVAAYTNHRVCSEHARRRRLCSSPLVLVNNFANDRYHYDQEAAELHKIIRLKTKARLKAAQRQKRELEDRIILVNQIRANEDRRWALRQQMHMRDVMARVHGDPDQEDSR